MGKVCNKCGREQPKTNYTKACNTPDGLQYVCKDCARAYREAHRAKNIEYMKQYYAEHKEEFRVNGAIYKDEHKEQISARNAKKYGENPEPVKQAVNARYHANKETILRKNKVWRDNNKDTVRITASAWRKNNPDVKKVLEQTRRAKKAGLASTLTPVQWKNILNAFSGQCAYCGAQDKALHQEHFVPVSSGGEFTHNNILPACGSCNSLKGKKDFFVWYPTAGCYDKQREKKIMRFLHYVGTHQQLMLCM